MQRRYLHLYLKLWQIMFCVSGIRYPLIQYTALYSFISYMETVVENNLAVARRGGNPTMLSLIDAFLNVKHLKPTQRHTQVIRSHYSSV